MHCRAVPHRVVLLGGAPFGQRLACRVLELREREGSTSTREKAKHMNRFLSDHSLSIGGTPPVKLNRVVDRAAVRLAKLPEFTGKTIVTELPDAGERNLSTVPFQNWA